MKNKRNAKSLKICNSMIPNITKYFLRSNFQRDKTTHRFPFLSYFYISNKENKTVEEAVKSFYFENKFVNLRGLFWSLKKNKFKNILNDNSFILNKYKERELIVRQLVIKNVLGKSFIRKLIVSQKKFKSLKFPLPIDYLIILKENGYKVSFFYSLLLWYLFVYYQLFNSFLFFLKFFTINLLNINKKKFNNLSDSIFFVNLRKKHFPNSGLLDLQNYNILQVNL